jgi:hypothetical protein
MPLKGIDLDNFHRAMQEKTMRKSDRRLCPTFISGISSRRQLPGPTTRDDGQDNSPTLPKFQNFSRFVIGSVPLRLARVVPFTSQARQVCA